MSDRPLTDAQERALIALVDLAREGSAQLWQPLRPDPVARYRTVAEPIRMNTASSLARLGLIEFAPTLDFGEPPMARATDAGIALCDSMGD